MKSLKEYLQPEFQIYCFDEDMIRTSGDNGFSNDDNELPIMPIFASETFGN